MNRLECKILAEVKVLRMIYVNIRSLVFISEESKHTRGGH